MIEISKEESKNIKIRRRRNKINYILFFMATIFGIVMLAILLFDIFRKGLPWLDWQFLTSFSSRSAAKAGIKAALAGSFWLMLLTAPISFLIGVGSAIYLNEYAGDTKLKTILQININNLAGVPSIVYGILGLGIFVKILNFGTSILAGALTMALLILPVIIVSSQEALKSVQNSLRNASYALGATKWQTISQVILPVAMPSILTGTILALSRAIGEAAPLIVVGALTYIAFVPKSPLDQFTVLPIQIFNWTSRPQEEFQYVAAAGIIVLVILLLSMNAIAIILRNKFQKR